jgi:prepilin-type N-terminal cleavage/methylation domain-containing protein
VAIIPKQDHTTPYGWDKGYSLLEILVTLTITLIIAGGSHIAYQQSLRRYEQADIHSLTELLRQARVHAIRTARRAGVCTLGKEQQCLSGAHDVIDLFVRRGGKRIALSGYTLKHPHAHLIIVASGGLSILEFNSNGLAPAFGGIYYCLPTTRRAGVAKITLGLHGELRQNFKHDRGPCDS